MKKLLVRAAVRLFVLVVPHGDSIFRTLRRPRDRDLLVRAARAVSLFVLVVPHGDSLFRTLLVRAVYGARVPRDRD